MPNSDDDNQQEKQNSQTNSISDTIKQRTSSSSYSSLRCCQILTPPVLEIGGAVLGEQEQQQQNDEDVVIDRITITYTPSDTIVWQCTFSPNGQYLAACYGGSDPCIRVWQYDENNNNQQRQGSWNLHTVLTGVHTRTIRSIAFAPIYSSLILASGSFDGTIAIWEQEIPSLIRSDRNTNNNPPVTPQWICSTQLEGHDNEVKCVVWNSTGSLLATCGRDKTVWIWECYLNGTVGGSSESEFECLSVLSGHDGDVKCILFAPSYGEWGDGDEILLSASYDDTIKCWAEDNGDWYCAATIRNVHSSTIWTLTLAPSGTRLLSGGADGCIGIYKVYPEREKLAVIQAVSSPDQKQELLKINTTTGNGLWKCVGTLPNAHKDATIYSLHYASTKVGHCRLVSAGGDNSIRIYRETTTSTSDTPQYELECQTIDTTDINCVCWHPLDGSILASAGDDGNVKIWTYETRSK